MCLPIRHDPSETQVRHRHKPILITREEEGAGDIEWEAGERGVMRSEDVERGWRGRHGAGAGAGVEGLWVGLPLEAEGRAREVRMPMMRKQVCVGCREERRNSRQDGPTGNRIATVDRWPCLSWPSVSNGKETGFVDMFVPDSGSDFSRPVIINAHPASSSSELIVYSPSGDHR
jgi:hypothetical protein